MYEINLIIMSHTKVISTKKSLADVKFFPMNFFVKLISQYEIFFSSLLLTSPLSAPSRGRNLGSVLTPPNF
jgi:hypothetical protein